MRVSVTLTVPHTVSPFPFPLPPASIGPTFGRLHTCAPQLCINENPGCRFIATNLDAVTHLTDAQEWAGNGAMTGAIKGCDLFCFSLTPCPLTALSLLSLLPPILSQTPSIFSSHSGLPKPVLLLSFMYPKLWTLNLSQVHRARARGGGEAGAAHD